MVEPTDDNKAKKRLEKLRNQAKALDEQRKATLKQAAATKDAAEQQRLFNRAQDLGLDIVEKLQLARGKSTKAVHEARLANEAYRKALEKSNKEVELGVQKAEDFKSSILGLDTQLGKFIERIPSGAREIKGFAKELMSFNTISQTGDKIVSKFVGTIIKMSLATDETISNFRKSTGAGKEFNTQISQLYHEFAYLGVEAAEAGQSLDALYANFSAFTQLNIREQRNIGNVATLLAEVGVSVDSTTRSFDISTRALQMSATQAADLALDHKALALAIKVPAETIAKGFAAAAPELAKYGKQMIKVFEELSVQAKLTGIETQRLISIAGQFDTFDKAGEAVGRLNALLGGPYLNSIDMLNATESERIDMMRRTMDMAGMQFDVLGRFEKQAIAAALGMNVEEAARIFGMGTLEYEKQILTQQKLAAEAEKMQTIMNQLRRAFLRLAQDLRPFIEDGLMPLIDHFTALMSTFDSNSGKMLFWAGITLMATGRVAVFAQTLMMARTNTLLATGALQGNAAAAAGSSKAVFGLTMSMKGLGMAMGLIATTVAAGFLGTMIGKQMKPLPAIILGVTLAVLGLAAAIALASGGANIYAGMGALAVAGLGVGLIKGGLSSENVHTKATATKRKSTARKIGDGEVHSNGKVVPYDDDKDVLVAMRKGGPLSNVATMMMSMIPGMGAASQVVSIQQTNKLLGILIRVVKNQNLSINGRVLADELFGKENSYFDKMHPIDQHKP